MSPGCLQSNRSHTPITLSQVFAPKAQLTVDSRFINLKSAVEKVNEIKVEVHFFKCSFISLRTIYIIYSQVKEISMEYLSALPFKGLRHTNF